MKYYLKNPDANINPFNIGEITNILFNNREITDINKYVAPTKDDLLNPFDLENMQQGINLLIKHIENNSKIFIIVDSDVDGYTSASILYNYIMYLYDDCDIEWMVHEQRSHGINLDLIPKDTKLVICPDSSSNEFDKHQTLKEQDIDVLVIDHHEATHLSEHAVVINNQLSPNYANKTLSGAGIVYKFCQGLDQVLKQERADYYLDLVALGIIADMSDVRPLENRYIIDQGLTNINNRFMQELINKQDYSLGSLPLNTIGVMFYLAPIINAVTRVGTLSERSIMFEGFIYGDLAVKSTKRGAAEKDLETIAEQAVRVAMNCKNKQKKLVDEVKQQIQDDLATQNLDDIPLILVSFDSIQNKNLTGLIANQLAAEYKRPVLFLVKRGDVLSGSGRNYGFHEVDNLKECLQNSNLVDFAEGHQSAFGVQIQEGKVEEFLDNINDFMPTSGVIEDQYIVDFIFDAELLTASAIQKITQLRKLWGKGFDEPLIVVEDIPVNQHNFTLMGQKSAHMKILHNNVSFIKFWIKEDDRKNFKDLPVLVTVVGRADINLWNNQINYQVIIQDYEIKPDNSYGF